MRWVALAAAVLAGCRSAPLSVAETPTRARTPDGLYISWKEHLIDDQQLSGGVPLRGGDGLQMADLDKDGHLDIVSVHEDSNHIRLAFGSEDPDRWELVTLADGDDAGAAEDVAIGDLNRDGWPDIIAACELAHLIYFQNPGSDVRTRRWGRTIPPAASKRGSFIRVFFADFNADGRLEVVAANKGEQLPTIDPRRLLDPGSQHPLKEISWFETGPEPLDGSLWKEQVLVRVRVPINSQPVDLDGNGDLDVLAGSAGEGRLRWMENLGGPQIAFREHPIEVTGRNAAPAPGHKNLGGMNVAFVDLSRDGRLDMVLQETPTLLVWLEQPAGPSEPWRIHRIGDIGPDSTTGVAVADINSDRRPDVITGGYSQNPRDHDGANITAASSAGRLVWFEHPGDPRGAWVRHDISRTKRGMYDAFVARDMDRDGDLDFVATRGNSGNFDGVFWLEQVRTPQPVPSFQPARLRESAHLPLPPP